MTLQCFPCKALRVIILGVAVVDLGFLKGVFRSAQKLKKKTKKSSTHPVTQIFENNI